MCYNYIQASGDGMSKVKINSSLHNLSSKEVYSTDTIGIKIDNKIKYQDNEINVVICVNEEYVVIGRKCKDYNLTLHLSQNNVTKGTYEIYSLGIIDLKITTNKFVISENKMKMNYILDFGNNEKQEFEFILEWEELK